MLLKDARTSFTNIAKDCNVSTNVIAKRFQRLKRQKIIIGSAVIASIPELEPKHRLAIDLKIEHDAIKGVIDEFRKNPLFRSYYKTVGPYDLHLAVGVRSLVEAEKIRNNLSKIKGVSGVVISASLDADVFLPENIVI